MDSIIDEENRIIEWKYFKSLNTIQESEGFTLANKLSLKHAKFETHKMNVKLAAQTLSSSVADAIEFLDFSMKLEDFQHSSGTVKFLRTIDRLFDILNSRNPPLRPESRDNWEEILNPQQIICQVSERTLSRRNCCQPIKEKHLSLDL